MSKVEEVNFEEFDKEETKEEKDEPINLDLILENREVYSTGFRNIDTNIAFRVYDESDNLVCTNRGILSGSWITYTGVPHSGKTTLTYIMAGNMMRKFVSGGPYEDHRVKMYIIDVESGANRQRFMQLTGFSASIINKHVSWVEDTTIEGFLELVNSVIKEKSDKKYTTNKRLGSSGHMEEMYPPTFIVIDAISELSYRESYDENEFKNTMDMTQNRLLQQLVKKIRPKLTKYNINIFAISHLANKGPNINNPMARPTREYKGISADLKINGGKALQFATDIGIFINRIEARDKESAAKTGGRHLEAVAISEATIFKNRQGLDNAPFYLVTDIKGTFDPLSSFLYDCKKFGVTEASGVSTKIKDTAISCRTQDIKEKIFTDEEFRTTLFNKYDELKENQLESAHSTKEERERRNKIFDIMAL